MSWVYYDPRRMVVRRKKKYALKFNGRNVRISGSFYLKQYARDLDSSTWIIGFRWFDMNDFKWSYGYHTMKVAGIDHHDMSIFVGSDILNYQVGFRFQYNQYFRFKSLNNGEYILFGFSARYLNETSIEYVAVVNDNVYSGTHTSGYLNQNRIYRTYHVGYPNIWRGHWFNGYVYFFIVYNRFMNANEIKRVLKNPLNPIRDGLVLWLVFEEGKGDKVYDLSGNGYHGTIYGDYEWVRLP